MISKVIYCLLLLEFCTLSNAVERALLEFSLFYLNLPFNQREFVMDSLVYHCRLFENENLFKKAPIILKLQSNMFKYVVISM